MQQIFTSNSWVSWKVVLKILIVPRHITLWEPKMCLLSRFCSFSTHMRIHHSVQICGHPEFLADTHLTLSLRAFVLVCVGVRSVQADCWRSVQADGWTLHFPYMLVLGMSQFNGLTYRQNFWLICAILVLVTPPILTCPPLPGRYVNAESFSKEETPNLNFVLLSYCIICIFICLLVLRVFWIFWIREGSLKLIYLFIYLFMILVFFVLFCS